MTWLLNWFAVHVYRIVIASFWLYTFFLIGLKFVIGEITPQILVDIFWFFVGLMVGVKITFWAFSYLKRNTHLDNR